MTKINLGDEVKCKVTGFVGVAVAKAEFINGCTQFSVAPKVSKDNKYPEEVSIDEGSLKVLKPVVKEEDKDDPPGGPSRIAKRMKGF